MTFPELLAYAVIFVGLPLCVLSLVRLVVYARQGNGGGRVLRERAFTQGVNTIVVALFAFVFFHNSYFDPSGPWAFQAMIITRTAILILALSTIYWLVLYRR